MSQPSPSTALGAPPSVSRVASVCVSASRFDVPLVGLFHAFGVAASVVQYTTCTCVHKNSAQLALAAPPSAPHDLKATEFPDVYKITEGTEGLSSSHKSTSTLNSIITAKGKPLGGSDLFSHILTYVFQFLTTFIWRPPTARLDPRPPPQLCGCYGLNQHTYHHTSIIPITITYALLSVHYRSKRCLKAVCASNPKICFSPRQYAACSMLLKN